MSLIVIVRNYFDQIIPVFHETKEFIGQNYNPFYIDFFRSFLVLFEIRIPTRLSYFFSFEWRKDIIYFPILRPEFQIARTNSGIFSTIPRYPTDFFPKNLNFFTSTNVILPVGVFQNGFCNSFFLALPTSLAFLINIRRYWLQDFKSGLAGTLGHRAGETIFFLIIANGFAPLWYRTGSIIPIGIGSLITIYFLWESFNYKYSFQSDSLSFKEGITNFEKFYFLFKINQSILFIFIRHIIYAISEYGTFFRVFRNQTLNTYDFTFVISYFSSNFKIIFIYVRGLFFGGLFFDLFFTARIFRIIENVLKKLYFSPSEWKRKINIWTKRIIVGYFIRRIPFYTIDSLIFSSFGFFGRDTELRRRVSRNAFSYSIDQGRQPSILFEGRYVIGEDSYGRPAPDIIHKPWHLSRLAIEASRDLVDETYRTQQTNQRVDRVYLGNLERKIFDWLDVRNSKNLTNSDKVKTIKRNKNSEKKTTEEQQILVRETIRKGLGSDITPKIIRPNSYLLKRPQRDIDFSINRFDRWFRATYKIINRESSIFNLPVDPRAKVPRRLFALYTSCSPIQPPQLASGVNVTFLEPDKAIRYSKSIEFSRIRNARRSPLHRGPILRYIDLLIKTRSPLIGFSRDISTRQQQNNLYQARLILNDYVNTSRKYFENIEKVYSTRKNYNISNTSLRRINWQQEVNINLFGGNRSRANSIYSQQYIGNLQLIRRLFAISWSPYENYIPSNLQTKEKKMTVQRRKISLDQITFDRQKNVFEHEEIGKTIPLKITNNYKRKQISKFSLSTIKKKKKIKKWTLLTKNYNKPEFRSEIKPLYAGWDYQQNAFILCNRYLPSEWSVRTKLKKKKEITINEFSTFFNNLDNHYYEKKRREFTVWPENFKTRRIRLHNVRYNRRAILRRKTFKITDRTITDSCFLSQDPCFWRRKAIEHSNISRYIIWLNPKSSVIETNNHPIRSSQSFPISLERSVNPEYVIGNFQPSVRGGMIWPGTNSFFSISKNV
jgi:hypothetical protein